MLEATLLEDAPRSAKAYIEEAFGPLALLSKFSDFDAALDEVNDSKFGLQAGIFTHDLFKVLNAWDRLEVGGVVINDVPSYRVDNMPYGGVKDSGLGREGVRFAMEDMSEIRNLVIRRR
jgi:acyl-CoA reductase-like NAD-dependent aldehyde dehydrogenase